MQGRSFFSMCELLITPEYILLNHYYQACRQFLDVIVSNKAISHCLPKLLNTNGSLIFIRECSSTVCRMPVPYNAV